jgi:hypothetical protein
MGWTRWRTFRSWMGFPATRAGDRGGYRGQALGGHCGGGLEQHSEGKSVVISRPTGCRATIFPPTLIAKLRLSGTASAGWHAATVVDGTRSPPPMGWPETAFDF